MVNIQSPKPKPSTHGLPPGFSTTTKPTGTLIVQVRGATGVGKTYTCLKTIPGPVIYLNGDRDNDLMLGDLRRIRAKLGRGELISSKRYALKFQNDVVRGSGPALDNNAAVARTVRDRFKAEYLAALESDVRFIVIDQSAFVWSLIRIARWGKLTEIAQILYSQANWEMEQIIHQAEDTGKVVVWISPSEVVWEDYIEQTPQGPKKSRRATDRTQSVGYKAFDFAMTVIAEMHYDLAENKRTMKIVKGVTGMGEVLEGKQVSIPALLTAATGVEDWA